jgi:Ca2+-binding EF-hand superfamily protein
MKKSGAGQDDKLFRLFESMDTNKDGMLDENEFSQILELLGWDSPAELRSLEFAAVDVNADGLVEFEEFADWWRDQN